MAATHLHPTDRQTQDQVAEQLMEHLQAGATAGMRAACAEALGLLAAGVASSGKPQIHMHSVHLPDSLSSVSHTLHEMQP